MKETNNFIIGNNKASNLLIIEDITQIKNNHINILNNKIIEQNNEILEFENKKFKEFEKNFNNKLYYELLIKEKNILTELNILNEKYKGIEKLIN